MRLPFGFNRVGAATHKLRITIMQFTKTVAFTSTDALARAALAGTVKAGQWVRVAGKLGQFVGLRANSVPNVSYAGQGDGFVGRTQRAARARWHLAYRHDDAVTAIRRAPKSVDDARLGGILRASFA